MADLPPSIPAPSDPAPSNPASSTPETSVATAPSLTAADAVSASIANNSTTRTVDRALALLAEVCAEDSISLAECARRARLPASTALRLLRTLEGSGFVARDEIGSFRAGARLIQLGAAALSRQSIVRLAEPALRRIVEATGETAYLAVLGPDETAIYIAMVEGTYAIRHTSWIGRSLPMAGLAVGRALVGDVGPGGYVAERDLLEPDVTAVVAPIFRAGQSAATKGARGGGGTVGALSLLGPTYRIDDETLHKYGSIVADEASQLAEQLGARPPAPQRIRATSPTCTTRQETGT